MRLMGSVMLCRRRIVDRNRWFFTGRWPWSRVGAFLSAGSWVILLV